MRDLWVFCCTCWAYCNDFPYLYQITLKTERARKMCTCMLSHFSCVRLFLTPWNVAHQAPLSMGFSRQEYWIGLPCPPPVYLSNWGLNLYLLCLLNWHMGSLPLAPPGKPKENIKWSKSHSVLSDSLQPHGLHIPWNSPGQNTGVGKLSLLSISSQLRNRTRVSCIAGGFFTNWAMREAPRKTY